MGQTDRPQAGRPSIVRPTASAFPQQDFFSSTLVPLPTFSIALFGRNSQVFQRVPSESPSTQDDARFEYFVGTVLPQILRLKQSHTAIFVPSYFDYVRVRNYLLKNRASVANVHEYSRGSEVANSTYSSVGFRGTWHMTFLS